MPSITVALISSKTLRGKHQTLYIVFEMISRYMVFSVHSSAFGDRLKHSFQCLMNKVKHSDNRTFSHDVTSAILEFKKMKRRPCWCSKPILWELNIFASMLATWLKPPYVTNLMHRTHNNIGSKWKLSLLITNLLFSDMYPPAYPDIDDSIFWIIFKWNFQDVATIAQRMR